MILKIVRTYNIDGRQQRGETFYEGKEIGTMENPDGMIFSVDGQPELIIVPDPEIDNPPPTDVYLMENGRTVERYHFGKRNNDS